MHCIYDFVKCPTHTKCSRAAQKLSAGRMPPARQGLDHAELAYNCVGYFSVTLRYARRAGALLPLFVQKGGNGAELTFHRSIIGNFMVNKI